MMKKLVLGLVVFGCVANIEAMQNVKIQNKMSKDVFVESFETSGTVVFNQIKLVGETLGKNDSKVIQIGVVSPVVPSEKNYAVLSLFNKTEEEYEQIKITWGGDGARLYNSDYVVNGFYRIVQEYDQRGDVTFTFYDYGDESIIERLKAAVLQRLKTNASFQQKQKEEIIKLQSGLKTEEIEGRI
ncbi:MAG: hypothetical protein E7015_04295 [Alphaproteobacteria bacterium]|nr:hypothetical protein [Alphaproteobacteria bacterium]